MKERELNFEEDMHIDESNLDVEMLEQSELTIKYGRHLAECKRKAAQCEENVKLVRSELMNAASGNSDLLESGNPTVGNLEAYYRNHKRHRRAKKESIEADFELELANIAYSAVHARKFSLENMIKLYSLNYFAANDQAIDITIKRAEYKKNREVNRDSSRKKSNSKVRIKQRVRRKRK